MVSFDNLELNDKVVWLPDEPHAKAYTATVTELHSDYAIAKSTDGMTLLIDEDTQQDFRKVV